MDFQVWICTILPLHPLISVTFRVEHNCRMITEGYRAIKNTCVVAVLPLVSYSGSGAQDWAFLGFEVFLS